MILSAVLFAGSLMAQRQMKPEGHQGGHNLMMLADELQLTDEQIEQFKDLKYEMEKKAIDLRANLEKERLELKRMMDADKPNRRAVISQAEKVHGIEGKLNVQRIEHELDIADILTDQQRTRLKELHRERPEHREGMGRPEGKMLHKDSPPPHKK